jgi:hypothetical protein
MHCWLVCTDDADCLYTCRIPNGCSFLSPAVCRQQGCSSSLRAACLTGTMLMLHTQGKSVRQPCRTLWAQAGLLAQASTATLMAGAKLSLSKVVVTTSWCPAWHQTTLFGGWQLNPIFVIDRSSRFVHTSFFCCDDAKNWPRANSASIKSILIMTHASLEGWTPFVEQCATGSC